MANKEHLDILKQGLEIWNMWRKQNSNITPDLRKVDLRRANLLQADLFQADLRRANLSRTNLSEANLSRADLSRADLSGANLSRAYLIGAKLFEVNLSRANFFEADLFEADLSRANLTETNLSRARIGQTMFGNNDLSMVKGLDTMEHYGPSTIGIDTFYRSRGVITNVFLRGAGIPEEFITYMRSRVPAGDFYSCFISHSNKDKKFCECLYADLQANGVRTWYFPEDAKWGETVWGEIDRSIRIYDKLVVVCSKSSLQSGPVLREIERALDREDKEKKNILFLIRIDNW